MPRTILAAAALSVLFFSGDSLAQQIPAGTLPTEEEAKLMLSEIDSDVFYRKIYALGSKAYPSFLAILNDDQAVRYHFKIYSILTQQTSENRRMFLPIAVNHLSSKHESIRSYAAYFIGTAGTELHAIPLAVLLSDPDIRVARGASSAMKDIGGLYTLAAFDVWLNLADKEKMKDLVKIVHVDRDHLERRLKKVLK